MADKTAIEWTDATWNPIRGTSGDWSCVKVSEGCQFCYAERLNLRRGGLAYRVGADTLRFDETILTQPLRWKRPRRIFVCSMTDLFAEAVSGRWIGKIFAVMAMAPQHTFQVLTKRAERMHDLLADGVVGPVKGEAAQTAWEIMKPTRWANEWSGLKWPLPNVWLGVSVENQARAEERIPWLLRTPAAVRFLSVEPLLGPVDLTKYFMKIDVTDPSPDPQYAWSANITRGLHWVIVGGESGGLPERALVSRTCACGDGQEDHVGGKGECLMPNDLTHGFRRCRRFRSAGFEPKHDALQWVRMLHHQCRDVGVPFFFKQWGGARPKSGGRLLDGKEWSEYPR